MRIGEASPDESELGRFGLPELARNLSDGWQSSSIAGLVILG